jgi:hypothetical protein
MAAAASGMLNSPAQWMASYDKGRAARQMHERAEGMVAYRAAHLARRTHVAEVDERAEGYDD